jgi:hypothetical protein
MARELVDDHTLWNRADDLLDYPTVLKQQEGWNTTDAVLRCSCEEFRLIIYQQTIIWEIKRSLLYYDYSIKQRFSEIQNLLNIIPLSPTA